MITKIVTTIAILTRLCRSNARMGLSRGAASAYSFSSTSSALTNTSDACWSSAFPVGRDSSSLSSSCLDWVFPIGRIANAPGREIGAVRPSCRCNDVGGKVAGAKASASPSAGPPSLRSFPSVSSSSPWFVRIPTPGASKAFNSSLCLSLLASPINSSFPFVLGTFTMDASKSFKLTLCLLSSSGGGSCSLRFNPKEFSCKSFGLSLFETIGDVSEDGCKLSLPRRSSLVSRVPTEGIADSSTDSSIAATFQV
mmetsp:Transcript_11418/g.16756  ORF Transcript_11418/g.16756 Transcript_11418/m.16756 type:complete len:253 (-) Transcript_11418:211-969(-)